MTGDLSIPHGGHFVGTSEAWEMTSEQPVDCNGEDNDILSSWAENRIRIYNSVTSFSDETSRKHNLYRRIFGIRSGWCGGDFAGCGYQIFLCWDRNVFIKIRYFDSLFQ